MAWPLCHFCWSGNDRIGRWITDGEGSTGTVGEKSSYLMKLFQMYSSRNSHSFPPFSFPQAPSLSCRALHDDGSDVAAFAGVFGAAHWASTPWWPWQCQFAPVDHQQEKVAFLAIGVFLWCHWRIGKDFDRYATDQMAKQQFGAYNRQLKEDKYGWCCWIVLDRIVGIVDMLNLIYFL